ncbi:TetR/AcrR family transcriptional regulator [Catenuloplanes atrovinosus]|uniref:AcrR family transcriptional regulator n=1 Tax=Catenuloplanes atrovinosus TaxID=137266 RepID=A0AAE4C9I2_9ACTN|nr:TetR family transcriptional regulator C-terminal domain-containing protein [Catenuloplanes atrovinosus]MDR7273615.1 AcrR family transcriptional regulator [Catenuloplanes atrovinosus]
MTRRLAEVRLDALLRTACDVIAERGLANTRTADVARAAGVSQALVFYHFATKERLLAQAFAYATEQDLQKLDAVLRSGTAPLDRLRRLVRLYAPGSRPKTWTMWIDGWSESPRAPELEKISRRRVLRWREALREVITDGVRDGSFTCEDAQGAAWRIASLIDGLAVQSSAHPRIVPRAAIGGWVNEAVARELTLKPEQLA